MNKKSFVLLFPLLLFLLLSSCSRMGYGVLLWSTEDPLIHSGQVLPVYLRSNIEQVWVVGLPDEIIRTTNIGYYDENGEFTPIDKVEIPLYRFEFTGRSRRRAVMRAEEFAPYASLYAENLQDGLAIREAPDNGARRVYRLRQGEIIKILSLVRGNPPIGTTGQPLEGDWYRVLTREGVIGFCFSYRLRIFDGYEESIKEEDTEQQIDFELEAVLARAWSPDFYLQMINSRRIIISEFEKRYRFDPGLETGVARVILPDLNMEFPYDDIVSQGGRAWRFDGSDLAIELRTNNSLAVLYTDRETGLRRSALFTALPSSINDIIAQENTRRNTQFNDIVNRGPVFTSNNYGTISFSRGGNFTWTDYDLLVPQLIPSGTGESGRIIMDLFLDSIFTDRNNGAFTMRFAGSPAALYFMYSLDNQGLRLEEVPSYAIEESVVIRRAASPMVLYFFRDSP